MVMSESNLFIEHKMTWVLDNIQSTLELGKLSSCKWETGSPGPHHLTEVSGIRT